MRKLIYIMFSLVAIQLSFASCNSLGNKNDSSDSTETKTDSSIHNGFHKSYRYKVYEKNIPYGDEGLCYAGVIKHIYRDGTCNIESYFNFSSEYDNQYSIDGINIYEKDIPNILEFLDSCSSYPKSTNKDILLEYRCKLGEDRIVYDGQKLCAQFKNGNRYTWDMPFTDIRNLISGMKVKMEQLKQEDSKKKTNK